MLLVSGLLLQFVDPPLFKDVGGQVPQTVHSESCIPVEVVGVTFTKWSVWPVIMSDTVSLYLQNPHCRKQRILCAKHLKIFPDSHIMF
jgi:hypothetical protein